MGGWPSDVLLKMKRVISIITIIILITGIAGFFMYHASPKKEYDEFKNRLPTPILQVQNIGPDGQDFINTVIGSWHKHGEQCPYEILTGVSKISGYNNNVEGLVRFANHKIQDYSYFDNEQNKQEIIISTALGTIIPVTKDDQIYHKSGFAYLRINDHTVEVYEDTKDGVRYSRYFKEQKRENKSQ